MVWEYTKMGVTRGQMGAIPFTFDFTLDAINFRKIKADFLGIFDNLLNLYILS